MEHQKGYQELAEVLQDALNQAQHGKGKKRHGNGMSFMKQPVITESRALGMAGPAMQARNKIREALNCDDDERAITDLLGAIVYTAAMVIVRREQMEEEQPATNKVRVNKLICVRCKNDN